MLAIVVAVIVTLGFMGFLFYLDISNRNSGGSNQSNSGGSVNIVTGSEVEAVSKTIGVSGGTLTVTDASSPLFGLRISVPENATNEPIQFKVNYADVKSVKGLPQDASVVSRLIDIQTSGSTQWNNYKMFRQTVEVTLPYDRNVVDTNDSPVRFFFYDAQNGLLDSAGFVCENTSEHTITFLTDSFSYWLAIKMSLGVPYRSAETGFLPKVDGWFIGNEGSYLAHDGFCSGMCGFAKWYYAYEKGTTKIGLHSKYIEGYPAEWRDDATAIQLATWSYLVAESISQSAWEYDRGQVMESVLLRLRRVS